MNYPIEQYAPTEADWEEYAAYLESLAEEQTLPECDGDSCPVCCAESDVKRSETVELPF